MSFPVWIDGELVPPERALVPIDDAGFQLGLAVFETLLVDGGVPLFMEEHLERMARSADALGIAVPANASAGLCAVARAVGEHEAALRVTLTRGSPGGGPRLVVSTRAIEAPPADRVVAVVSDLAKRPGDPLDTVKSTNRMLHVLARERARALGAWEALLPTTEGDLLEGTVSNLFVRSGDLVVTPPEERGLLAGITREHVLAELEAGVELDGRRLAVSVERVDAGALAAADEVLLTSTTGRALGLHAVLGRVEGLPGPSGPLATELRRRLLAAESAYRAAFEHA